MTVTRQPTGQDLVCLVCGTNQDIDIDHVQAKGMGGSKERDVPENKTPLCRGHHDAKHRHVLETRVEDGVFKWRKRGAGVWIAVRVEVSQRYGCLVGRLSDGAEGEDSSKVERAAVTGSSTSSSAPSLKEEESGAGAGFGVLQKIVRRQEESDGRDNRKRRGDGERDADRGGDIDISGLRGRPAQNLALEGDDVSHGGNIGHDRSGAASPLTHEQRVAITKEIRDAEWGRQWIAGDTGNAWIAELGEEAEQYLSDFGYVHESLANILRVCAAIPVNIRRPSLRFSHHVVVADQNREDMEMWLDKCEEEEWSVAEMRRQVKGFKPKTKRWPMGELLEGLEAWPHPTDRPRPKGAVRAYLAWLGEQE